MGVARNVMGGAKHYGQSYIACRTARNASRPLLISLKNFRLKSPKDFAAISHNISRDAHSVSFPNSLEKSISEI